MKSKSKISPQRHGDTEKSKNEKQNAFPCDGVFGVCLSLCLRVSVVKGF